MKAVLMAGGEGSRLRPLTANRPKPLAPVGNRPIMHHIVDLLARHGVTEIVATLHYLAEDIRNYFGDGSDMGVRMHYSIEDTPLGTAGSVKQAEEHLKDETFFIVSGDALTDCDLTKALEFHRRKGALATLVLYRVQNPRDFGVVITREDGQIERFLEKPGWSEVFSDTANTGIYILEPRILEKMRPGVSYDWSQDIFPKLLRAGEPLYGYVMEEYWTDVGTLSQYKQAQDDLLDGRMSLSPAGTEIRPRIWVGDNSVIDESVTIHEPVCIGRHTRIRKNATIGPHTIIGDNCLVEEGAQIEDTVVWDRCYLGANVQTHSATICSRVTLKRDAKVLEEAVIGDRCLIDVGCVIRPRVKIWPDKIVERGATVTMSIVYGNKWRGSLFRELGVAGLSNIEMTPEFATRFGLATGSSLPERSRVITARDSSRSSRMIKRSLMSSLLSAGCDLTDLQGSPVPITRHHAKHAECAAVINVRKLPGNSRVTLIEIFDHDGGYVPEKLERKIEAAFSREDFHRVDSEDVGVIEQAPGAVESYQHDFFDLAPKTTAVRRLKVVVDYGFSSISPIFPAMLPRLGVDAVQLNAFNDAKHAPRNREEKQAHIEKLGHIVESLNSDLGILITNEGERLSVVDNRGRLLEGHALFAALCLMVADNHSGARIAMSVTAPSRLEELLRSRGAEVVRTRSSVRDLMNIARDQTLAFAGDEDGGFIFPALHPGFDAMFSFANLAAMLRMKQESLGEIVDELPEFHMAYGQVHCEWEHKGTVMRVLTEEHRDEERLELMDGIKIYDKDSWVLVLPDSFEPVFHLHAESPEAASSEALVQTYSKKIQEIRTRR